MFPGRRSFYIGPPAVAWRVALSMRIRGSGLTTRSSRPLAALGAAGARPFAALGKQSTVDLPLSLGSNPKNVHVESRRAHPGFLVSIRHYNLRFRCAARRGSPRAEAPNGEGLPDWVPTCGPAARDLCRRLSARPTGAGDMSMARMWSSNSEPPTAASISFRSLPKNWCARRSMSSWLRLRQPLWQPRESPRRCRSSLWASSTQSSSGSSRVWSARAETSQDSPPTLLIWPASAWNCSGQSFPGSDESR